MIVKHLYVEHLYVYNSTFVDVLLYVVMQDYKYTMVSLKNKVMLLFFHEIMSSYNVG